MRSDDEERMLLQAEALQRALTAVPLVPTANIPATTRDLPMAHTPEPPIRAIERALREHRKARTSWLAFLVQLASPVALLGKGIVDFMHAVTAAPGGGYAFQDLTIPLLAVAAIAIGGAAAIVIVVHFVSSNKGSELHDLAETHIKELLLQMGAKPLE